ncbi:MAG: DUF4916 domain-containing protein [Candidatus Adlerbacteria bacterium]
MYLKEKSTEELAQELLDRTDLLTSEGVIISKALYTLIERIVPIMCVDMVPVRRNRSGELEAMAIVRNTGKLAGKLCSVGGRINRRPESHPPESIEDALRRHARTDLGCEIKLLVDSERPVILGQFAPREKEENWIHSKVFLPESTKHAISSYFPVELIGEVHLGETLHGGQEARDIQWFTLADMPAPEKFIFGVDLRFKACLEVAERLIL